MQRDMIERYYQIGVCLTLTLLLIAILVHVPLCSAQSATVQMSPSTITATIDSNFTINITISDVADLYGWEFKINWSATLLDVVSVVEGPFLKSGGSTFFYYCINVTTGRMIVDCTLLSIIAGVNGDGTLAMIIFHVKDVGECPFDLYDVLLVNSFEQLMSCQALDGYGYFTISHDVAVTNVSPSPITTLPSNPVEINVTVQNHGGFNEIFNLTAYANFQIIGRQTISLNKDSSATILFTLDTSGFGEGDYTISALASTVSGEVDTADNAKVANEVVTILYPGHDLTIVAVKLSKTIVGQGYCVYINVTVKNYGIFSETFVTTTYANATVVQSKTNALPSGSKIVLTFTWNTTGFAKDNYSIRAYVWPVLEEIDIGDNNLVDGSVIIAIIGDITGFNYLPDGKVDMRDISKVAKLFGAAYPNSRYDPNCDILYDLKTDMKDIGLAAKHFGEQDP